jgi:hypothetical protein
MTTYAHHPSAPEFSDTPAFAPAPYNENYRTDVLTAVDWLGARFGVGERVMYCIGAGHGQMMAVGTVVAMRALEVNDDFDRETRTWRGKRWDVEVRVLTEKTSGHWGNRARSKPAWVNPMNITSLRAFEAEGRLAEIVDAVSVVDESTDARALAAGVLALAKGEDADEAIAQAWEDQA